ncbi:MAG TPA: hypothetical protein VKH43_01225 [Thermoanaerobaculia bacterium]|nr:hypothetical protein [Thermoanaerobaculia bacterium]
MRALIRRILPRWTILVLVLCPFAAGCCTQMFGNAISYVKGQVPTATDVAVILLEPDKTYFPDRLLVKNKAHMIVWIAEADMLKVDFKAPKPAGVTVKCSADISDKFRFLCFTSAPFNETPPGPGQPAIVYKYTATVQCNGKPPVTIDPEVEIVF